MVLNNNLVESSGTLDGSLEDVTPIIEWLKESKPNSEVEVDALIRLIVDWGVQDGRANNRYEFIRCRDSLWIFGDGLKSLRIKDGTMRQYMLDVLDGLKKELSTLERHAVVEEAAQLELFGGI